MNQKEFLNRQQEAVQKMREMSARASRPPQNGKAQQKTPEKKSEPPVKRPAVSKNAAGLNIPLLSMLGSDSDTTLILGLLLILMGDGADKMLMLALIYILI